MSSLSARLLGEMNEQFSENEDNVDEVSSESVEVQYEYISGLRKGSRIVWAYQEMHLYYINAFSKKTGLTACTCYERNCKARIFIRADHTAFKEYSHKHENNHGSHYEVFKHMYCVNKMKDKASSAPASMQPYEIYKEVLVE